MSEAFTMGVFRITTGTRSAGSLRMIISSPGSVNLTRTHLNAEQTKKGKTMNPTETEFRTKRNGPSQNDKLEAYFRARPGQWIDMPELARAITPTGIGCAVHSRVSDLREERGMTIEQKNTFYTEDDRPVCCSRYRFTPSAPGHEPAKTLTGDPVSLSPSAMGAREVSSPAPVPFPIGNPPCVSASACAAAEFNLTADREYTLPLTSASHE